MANAYPPGATKTLDELFRALRVDLPTKLGRIRKSGSNIRTTVGTAAKRKPGA